MPYCQYFEGATQDSSRLVEHERNAVRDRLFDLQTCNGDLSLDDMQRELTALAEKYPRLGARVALRTEDERLSLVVIGGGRIASEPVWYTRMDCGSQVPDADDQDCWDGLELRVDSSSAAVLLGLGDFDETSIDCPREFSSVEQATRTFRALTQFMEAEDAEWAVEIDSARYYAPQQSLPIALLRTG